MKASPETASGSLPEHIKALDGLRAISILLVLAAHGLPLGPSGWQLNAASGLMGMSLFFCLSGFLIITLLQRNADAVSFLIRRILRIVPAVAVYVLIMVVLFGIGWLAVVENALFITNYNAAGRGRGEVAAPMSHLWSLSVEMHFYIAIGLGAFLLGKRCVWLVIPAALIITGLRIDAGAYSSINTHLRVDEILSGGILALVAAQYGPGIKAWLDKRASVGLFLLVGAMLLWLASCHFASGPLMYARPYCTALMVGLVIYVRVPLLHDILEGRIAAYIAKISYALYIYHPLMLWGWMNEGTLVERYLMKRPVSFALAFAAAHISTFWWERHWQALARRMTRNRSAGVSS